MLNPQHDAKFSSQHMQPVRSPITNKSLPVAHGLGHFQPYSPWSSPIMSVTGEFVPRRSSMGSAGYQLFAAADCMVSAQKGTIVSTGIAVRIPMGHYGKIEGNSSLAFQHNIVSFGGIIDELDTNTIQIKMFNFGTGTYRVKRGDCIAQLIIQRYCVPNIQQVLSVTAND